MAEYSRRYNLRDTRKKPQGVLLKRWEMEYSKLISNENRRIPLETVKSAIAKAFEDGMFEQWRISLKCLLSGQRIKVPARYADCTHIECFDLEAFLRMKTQKNLLVCPICQKQVEKPLANLRIDKYIETVLSTLPDAMQVELLSDGSFTEVHEEFVTAANVIDDEEPYVQDSNTSSFDVKQEALEDDDEYISLSDGEDGSIEEIEIVEDQHNVAMQNANTSRKKRNFSGLENDESETMTNEDDQNCSTDSATITQLNVKTEPEDVETFDAEILGIIEMRKRKASSNAAEHTPHRSGESAQHNVKSEGENSDSRELEPTKKKRVTEEPVSESSRYNQGTSNTEPSTNDGIPLSKQSLLGSANELVQISDFNSKYDQEEGVAASSTSTIAHLTNTYATGLLQHRGEPSNDMETLSAAKLTNKILVCGPCLHPEQGDPRVRQREDLQVYFSKFGKINSITVIEYDNSKVEFDNCESAAKCLQQRKHKIGGQDFFVDFFADPTSSMKKQLEAVPVQNDSSNENVSRKLTKGQRKRLAMTDKIAVSGPCLHPKEKDPKASQEEELRTYFGQFGRINEVTIKQTHYKNWKVIFDNCESVAKCIQQGTHKIRGQDFFVRTSKITPDMKKKLRANLDGNTPHSSSENVTVPNNQPKLLAGSTNRIFVGGPCLYPEQVDPIGCQKRDIRMYFSQFGQIIDISMEKGTNAKITFISCDSVANCLQQDKHEICGQDFIVRQETSTMQKKISANLEQTMPEPSHKNLSVSNNQCKLPVGVTNKILVCGPCLHPEHVDPKGCQRRDLQAYFSKFGKIIHIAAQIHGDAIIAFDNCESVEKCLRQDKHKIGGQDFLVRKMKKATKSMKKQLRATLNHNMPGSSIGNVFGPNMQRNLPAISNIGSQLSHAPASSSSNIYGSVMNCGTNPRGWVRSHGVASFNKPGYK